MEPFGGRTPDHMPIDDHQLVDGTGKVIFLGTPRQCEQRWKEIARLDAAYGCGCGMEPVR